MKKFLKFAVLSLAAITMCACDDDKSYVDPGLEVTPHNLSGTWQLAEWQGAPLAEGSFVYIELTRKDQLFSMYQNLDSALPRELTGRFAITTDEELGAIVMGQYDYGMATGTTSTSSRTSMPTRWSGQPRTTPRTSRSTFAASRSPTK